MELETMYSEIDGAVTTLVLNPPRSSSPRLSVTARHGDRLNYQRSDA